MKNLRLLLCTFLCVALALPMLPVMQAEAAAPTVFRPFDDFEAYSYTPTENTSCTVAGTARLEETERGKSVCIDGSSGGTQFFYHFATAFSNEYKGFVLAFSFYQQTNHRQLQVFAKGDTKLAAFSADEATVLREETYRGAITKTGVWYDAMLEVDFDGFMRLTVKGEDGSGFELEQATGGEDFVGVHNQSFYVPPSAGDADAGTKANNVKLIDDIALWGVKHDITTVTKTPDPVNFEDFNSNWATDGVTNGWIVSNYTNDSLRKVTTSDVSKGHSLKMTTITNHLELLKKDMEITGKFDIDTDVMVASDSRLRIRVNGKYADGSSVGNQDPVVFDTNSKVEFCGAYIRYDGSDYIYTPNSWYHVKLGFDLDLGQVTLTLTDSSGTQILNDTKPLAGRDDGNGGTEGMATLTRYEFYVHPNNEDEFTVYLDNLLDRQVTEATFGCYSTDITLDNAVAVDRKNITLTFNEALSDAKLSDSVFYLNGSSAAITGKQIVDGNKLKLTLADNCLDFSSFYLLSAENVYNVDNDTVSFETVFKTIPRYYIKGCEFSGSSVVSGPMSVNTEIACYDGSFDYATLILYVVNKTTNRIEAVDFVGSAIAGTPVSLTANVTVPAGASNYELRAYIWEDFSTMKRLAPRTVLK